MIYEKAKEHSPLSSTDSLVSVPNCEYFLLFSVLLLYFFFCCWLLLKKAPFLTVGYINGHFPHFCTIYRLKMT